MMAKIEKEKQLVEENKFRQKFNVEMESFFQHLDKNHISDEHLCLSAVEVSNPLIGNHSPIESPRDRSHNMETQRN